MRRLLDRGRLDLPLPGQGGTAQRLSALLELARDDVSVARLAEAHTDAVAILAEAGRRAPADAWYGVWASEAPQTRLELRRVGGGWRLHGAKAFCSGAPLVDRALVTAWDGDTQRLVDVQVRGSDGFDIDTSGWVSPAFAATGTATIALHDVAVTDDDLVGAPGFYLDRPGFWHGALAPAACWAGGAIGLVDHVLGREPRDAHAAAHRGALDAAAWNLRTMLHRAGDEVDAAPSDRSAAHRRALVVRHLVERTATEILDRFGRVSGPRPLAFDPALSRRAAEVTLYVRQSHAEHDLATLGALSVR